MNYSLDLFLLLPVVFALSMITGLWFLYTLRDGRRDVKKLRPNIYQCVHCRRIYTDPRSLPVVKCPGCRCTNEAIKR